MDDLDLKILDELHSNGYHSASHIAPAFHVGERTVRRRINAMRDSGAIKVVAFPNPISFGCQGWAKVGIKVAAGMSHSVAHDLVESNSIYFVAYSLGRFDFIIAVLLETLDRLTSFVNSEVAAIPGVLSTETMIMSEPRKYYGFRWYPRYYDSEGATPNVRRSDDQHSVDDIDRAIVSILMKDALVRPRELVSKLHLSEIAIRKRIKKLLEAKLMEVAVVTDPSLLPGEVWTTVGINVNHRSPQSVIEEILENPDVYLASHTHGRFNVIVSGRFRSLHMLNDFVLEELPAINGINSVESFLHNRPLKYHNIAWHNYD